MLVPALLPVSSPRRKIRARGIDKESSEAFLFVSACGSHVGLGIKLLVYLFRLASANSA
jgi:hypothetical protein